VTDEIYGEIYSYYSQAQAQPTQAVRREASLEALSGGDWYYQEIPNANANANASNKAMHIDLDLDEF
jgi:hypothetical protein